MTLENTFNSLEFFTGCDVSVFDRCSFLRKYSKGDVFAYEGDTSSNFVFLVSGDCKAFKMSRDSDVFLFRLGGGDLLCDFSLVGDPMKNGIFYSSNLEFLSDAIVLFVDEVELLKHCKDSLLKATLKRNKLLNESINKTVCFDAVAKVSYMLLNELDFFNSMSRKSVAYFLNVTEETLSRVLSRLAKSGFISSKIKNVEILDAEALKSFFP